MSADRAAGARRAAGGPGGAHVGGRGADPTRWPASHWLAHVAGAGWLTCLGMAWWRYPGGSWAEADAAGFAPWRNYWCDLMRQLAWNGEANVVGARWGVAAFALLGLASLGLFLGAAALLAPGPARRVRVGGALAALAVLAVAFVPYETYRNAHAVSSLLAGLGVAVATIETVLRSWRLDVVGLVARLAGATFLVAALANLAVYLPLVVAGGGESDAMPVIQKLATLALVLWLPSILAAARRARG